jgi:hypothetical protein
LLWPHDKALIKNRLRIKDFFYLVVAAGTAFEDKAEKTGARPVFTPTDLFFISQRG